jgi:hypothetical protein
MIQQISEEFGYFEGEHFRGIRLPFYNSNQLWDKKRCMTDINHTNRTQDCFKKLPIHVYNFLVFLPQKRFGLAEALKHLDGATIKKLMNSNESKTQVDVSFLEPNIEQSF